MITAPPCSPAALLLAGPGTSGELTALVRSRGFTPLSFDEIDSVGDVREEVTLCLVDLRRNGDALRAVRQVRSHFPDAVILGVADADRPSSAADAIRAGAFDVLPSPAAARDLDALLANAAEQARPVPPLRADPPPFGIVGTSAAMRQVMEVVRRAAAGRCGILVCGERGTGREMIARAIHANDPNRTAPFVTVDCSASGQDDIELHLFGVIHKRASHDAAERRMLERVGPQARILGADGGILFLENIVELPARAQARLVRVLRDREVFVGDAGEPQALDVRPIAAVDSSIEAAVEDSRLRADLFERLSLIRVDVPALRQRREDIPLLATHVLKELCRANGIELKTLTRPALTLLAALQWRGNTPELRSLLERLVLLVPHGLIRLEDILAHVQLDGSLSPTGFDATLRQARARFERDYIAAVLQHHHGRIAEAARVLGIQRTNLYRKMRRLNLMRGGTAAREA